jgi:glycerophosphoryl diester phosphodiesterase
VGQNFVVLVIAHRGASRAEIEHTPAAFLRADSMGADGVELDVRVAVDGSLVVAHDPLPRSPTSADDRPALLSDVLDSCGSRMLVNVEIKNFETEPDFDPEMAIADATIEHLRRRGGDSDRWLISSFSWATIDHCRRVAPEFSTAALCRKVSATALERVARAGHSAVNPAAATVDLVDRAHALGLAVNVWTVNDPDRIIELRDVGVDGLVTPVPDRALAALGRVGGPDLRPRWGRRA